MQKPNSVGGRPKHVAEFIEGKEAAGNFLGAMRHILSTPKTHPQQNGSGHEKRQKNGK
jgi:hypothetical protein